MIRLCSTRRKSRSITFRGGCWFMGAGNARAAYRTGSDPKVKYLFTGFRVVVLNRGKP